MPFFWDICWFSKRFENFAKLRQNKGAVKLWIIINFVHRNYNTNHLELMYLKPNSIKLTPAIPENFILCMRYVTNSIVWERKLYKKKPIFKVFKQHNSFFKSAIFNDSFCGKVTFKKWIGGAWQTRVKWGENKIVGILAVDFQHFFQQF